jgi:hypothetical protein
MIYIFHHVYILCYPDFYELEGKRGSVSGVYCDSSAVYKYSFVAYSTQGVWDSVMALEYGNM